MLLFPPIHVVWIGGIAELVLINLKRKTRLIRILTAALFLFFILGYLLNFWILLDSTLADWVLDNKRVVNPIGAAVGLGYGILLLVTTRLTVKYDRLDIDDYHWQLHDNIDYIKRFFVLLYWILGVWFYHDNVKQMLKNEP